jgi:drug/metabolite transporter (DMT)-like permease
MKSTHSTVAVTLVVFSALLFAMMDGGTKYLSGLVSLVLVLWTRYTIQAGLMAVWLLRMRGYNGFATQYPRLQILRGVLLLSMGAAAFWGLRLMPLAEFTAIAMLAPIVVTAVAGLMLKESVGRLRWALVMGGFIATLIVIRPGSGLFGAAAGFPILGMLIMSAYSLLTGRLALLEDPYTTQFYTGLTGSVLLLPFLLQSTNLSDLFHYLTWVQWAVLLLIGVMGTIGHLTLLMAFGRAGTASLMPFLYIQIAFAAVISWLVFQHAPDFWAWVGMAMIAICGAATAWLNIHTAQRAGGEI